jgi:hypothetical protein
VATVAFARPSVSRPVTPGTNLLSPMPPPRTSYHLGRYRLRTQGPDRDPLAALSWAADLKVAITAPAIIRR